MKIATAAAVDTVYTINFIVTTTTTIIIVR